MGYKVKNAIIMAAGASSRFAPLSYEFPKAFTEVKGEKLIERQIRQLKEAGIDEIIIVTGYMKESFLYLKEKFGVIIVENDEYLTRNNNSSIYAVKEYLGNSYICSSDNYFLQNPFESEVDAPYYAALYSSGETAEWCISEGEDSYINNVQIGGRDSYYMLGHVFWNEEFSRRFLDILEKIYDLPETASLLWEAIYMKHLDTLKLKIRKYPDDMIFEFDTLDELRAFDVSYVCNTRSNIVKFIAKKLNAAECELSNFSVIKKENSTEAAGFTFTFRNKTYEYMYETQNWRSL